MSEFVSLYLEASISKANLTNFLKSPSQKIENYHDWLPWLSAEERMIGDPQLLLGKIENTIDTTTEESLKEAGIQYHYDVSTKSIQFFHLHIDANFGQILPVVALMRGIAAYIDNQQNQFLVVYPYWWGDRETVNESAVVFISFSNGQSVLERGVSDNISQATIFFDRHGERLAKEFYEENGYF